MLWEKARQRLARFRERTDGVMTVEMVITLPFLFWMITTSFELFEVHRYKAARVKATYTVADMLSRELLPVNDTYITNAKALFDSLTLDNGANQLRVSVVLYRSSADEFEVRWSEVRGPGDFAPLTTAQVATAHDQLPILQGGEELIIVESNSTYRPVFKYPGLNNDYEVNTKTFSSVRFQSQLCWEGSYCG